MTKRLYFDKRRLDDEGRGALRYMVSKDGKTAMFSFDIKLLPDQWDGIQVVNHPDARLFNSVIKMKLGAIERVLLEKTTLGELAGRNAKEIVNILLEELDPDKVAARMEAARKKALNVNGLSARFESYISNITNSGTKQLYRDTLNKIEAFCTDSGKDLSSISFDDVDVIWLRDFEQFCLRTQKQNTASRHLRDIRAVFNKAREDKKTTNYPFGPRVFKIIYMETKDKSFTADELRAFFNYNSPIKGEQEAIDMFKLMFCLIGINEMDLINCAKADHGRIYYYRNKTVRRTGKLMNIKLEPEALSIINKYKGKDLLLNVQEKFNPDTYCRRMDRNLKKVGKVPVPGKASIGEALLPGVSTGSARTSWATIAQEDLDIDRYVISEALGHQIKDVTSTYLRTDWRKKVDEANRKVLDWVFYNKK